jgi:cyclopropane fatty-acyl-phospholipid synthase-like methyltransferase
MDSQYQIRQSGPAERNKQPILEVLAPLLPPDGIVLEIASGTGQHVEHFARACPNLTFQPSEVSAEQLPPIEARLNRAGLANVMAPIVLDVCELPWPVPAADVIVNCNMVHISPFATSEALFEGAGLLLAAGGLLFMYGPFRHQGKFTAESNAAFDQSLRQRNPAWGIRDVDALLQLANKSGLMLEAIVDMPANNHALVFRMSQGDS